MIKQWDDDVIENIISEWNSQLLWRQDSNGLTNKIKVYVSGLDRAASGGNPIDSIIASSRTYFLNRRYSDRGCVVTPRNILSYPWVVVDLIDIQLKLTGIRLVILQIIFHYNSKYKIKI